MFSVHVFAEKLVNFELPWQLISFSEEYSYKMCLIKDKLYCEDIS